MNEKPTQHEIETYLNWLKDPDGDSHLQVPLPLSSDIGRQASSERPDYVKSSYRPTGPARRENAAHSESEAKSRIRCLAVAGLPIPEIARRTGCHPKYVEAVIEPGRLNRRYE